MHNIKPIGQNILIRLPKFQKQRERISSGGIHIPHLQGKMEHDSTHGTVVAIGPDCAFIEIGDEVFFTNMCITQGQQNTFRGNKTSTNDANPDVPVFYLEDTDFDYLMMPWKKIWVVAHDKSGTWNNTIFQGVLCLIRNEQVICLNDYFLIADAYDKGELQDGAMLQQTASGLFIPKLREEDEKKKCFKVLYAPDGFDVEVGQVIHTLPHCDLPLEGGFNYNLLPKGTYWIEHDSILAIAEFA